MAHVEAGLRSFDLSMPEERNRIEVDRLSALLFCPDDRSAAQLEQEGVPGRREVVGDVMGDATRLFEPVARRARARPTSRRTRHSRSTGRRTRSPTACARSSPRSTRSTNRRFVFPVHPRTRHVLDEHGVRLAAHVEAIEPLGYLEMLALAAGARSRRHRFGRTAEGGVLAARAVRDVAAEHRVGRHRGGRGEPSRRAGAARARHSTQARFPEDAPAALRRRSCLGAHRGGPVRLTAVPESTLYDVAVIGAGYVGLPLAVTFAEAGRRVLVIDVQPRIVEALNGGTSHIEDVTSERLRRSSTRGSSSRARTTSR